MPTVRGQSTLPFSTVRNSELFSNHWITNRLPLEPEWQECREEAENCLEQLIHLWQMQGHRVAQFGSEQALEQAFIQPVLHCLGWKLLYQTHLRGRKPDFALFADDESLDKSLAAGRLNEEFWKFPTLVGDAKAWHVALDRRSGTGAQREYPPEQIEWYLQNSHLPYGLITNGRLWRLVPRSYDPGQPRFQTYLECDLARLLTEINSQPQTLFRSSDDFLRFYLFFSPRGFVGTLERPALLERARKGSTIYRVGVGEDLKERVLEALRLCIEGFLSFPANQLDPERDLVLCKEQSLILLYRLLFILFAEDRQLLPFRVDRAYTDNRSLGRFRDDIAAKLDRIAEGRDAEYGEHNCELWQDLLSLFDLIDRGNARYKVPAYNGGLFDPELHPFLSEKALPDRYLARIIDQLGRAAEGGTHDFHVRVDYRDLAIQHLGNVYEGLLEVFPHYAHEDMAVVRKKDSDNAAQETVQPASAKLEKGFEYVGPFYKQGSIYLLTDKGERRASGSYYTPNNIVDYIVERTIGPLCERIERTLLCAGEQDGTRSTFDKEVLKLRILDPAIGSGHFLIRACQYLAEQIATNPLTDDSIAEGGEGDSTTLTFWKRRVAEKCLFGIDRNPLAVELAKLALWLETVSVSQPLTFLDHHLRHGDTIIGAMIADLASLPDAPPLISNIFEETVQSRLPAVFNALRTIRETPSDTVQQVKAKQRALKRELEPARAPFRDVANVWCSSFLAPFGQQITLQQFSTALQNLNDPRALASSLAQEPVSSALAKFKEQGIAAFHWELEYPDVFFPDGEQQRCRGFDAVIGNPPYDVISEKETGHDLDFLKKYVSHATVYKPSRIGKNNLYKLFICRAVQLLADNGNLGLITPMAVLGDEQASGIRKLLLRQGSLTGIEAFPQKDNPDRRVFRDAKLSTAVVLFEKSLFQPQPKQFKARVHRGNTFDDDSPSLRLTSADIPLYDPENMTVVSCAQEDWEVAVRIMQSGRLQRLGNVCTSFQGEVNETTEKRRGAIATDDSEGPQILRGSNVCLYVLREASQGESLYLRTKVFHAGKSADAKAFHSSQTRVGFQRSSPQNNFRRLVSCWIPKGHYCFDTVSYIPETHSQLPLELILALLNSKLLEWYFRLGSTNSKVNEYQFKNLPCPIFGPRVERSSAVNAIKKALTERDEKTLFGTIQDAMSAPPFDWAVAECLIETCSHLIEIESKRGEITRNQRSALSIEADFYQSAIDRIVFGLAGLSNAEIRGIEDRLSRML